MPVLVLVGCHRTVPKVVDLRLWEMNALFTKRAYLTAISAGKTLYQEDFNRAAII